MFFVVKKAISIKLTADFCLIYKGTNPAKVDKHKKANCDISNYLDTYLVKTRVSVIVIFHYWSAHL